MSGISIALINSNRIKPPIAPIGLEYIAEWLLAHGHVVDILDLCWEKDPFSAIHGFFRQKEYALVGITLRNIDDCGFASRFSFVPEFIELVRRIKSCTSAPVILGGVGFSIMPASILSLCPADAGIWGDGEGAFFEIAQSIAKNQDWHHVSNLVWNENGTWRQNPSQFFNLEGFPSLSRNTVDQFRYFREGGQAGVETKRGCPESCLICADPVAKGNALRFRSPLSVAQEIEALIAQGIDCFHTCDPEFNIPESHALAVCEELIRRGLHRKIQWYAYCAPVPFSQTLAKAMAKAGCVGINFGFDSGDAGMLRVLGRKHVPEHAMQLVHWCRGNGITVMLDLVIGAPGESRESIIRTIEIMKKANPDRIGVNVGVRVYPGTPLAQQMEEKGWKSGLVGGPDPSQPLFFLEPNVAPYVMELLSDLVGEDSRFLFFDPKRPLQNYNYNANALLSSAIQRGHRGAYWDILRKIQEEKLA